MKKALLSILIISLTVLNPLINLYGQVAVYDLTKCIETAISNNISYKISNLDVEMQRHALTQSRASILPSLSVNASHGYNWGQTVDLYTNEFATERVQTNNFYIQSGFTLFNGFRLLNTVRQQHLNLMARKLDGDNTLNEIILNVSTAYMQVLYSYEQLSVSKGQVDITRQQAEQTRTMVEGGMMARGEILSIEAQLAAEEVNLVRSQNSLDMALLALSQIMNMPPGKEFEIFIPNIEDVEISGSLLLNPQHIYNMALEIQPDIKSAEINVNSAETGVQIAKGSILPSLYISASIGTGFSGARKDYSQIFAGYQPTGMFTSAFDTVYAPVFSVSESLRPFGTQLNDNFNQTVAIYLSIPIFNGLQTNTDIRRSKIAFEHAKYNLDLTKQKLLQEITQAHADAVAAFKNYEAAKKSVTALEESFKYTSEKFNIGMINSLEYNDSKNRLTAAESQMLGARYEYIFKTKLLDFYMGKDIEL